MQSTTSVWPQTAPQNIIVRMPNWLGDLVMATPVLAELREKWPEARITAMALSGVGQLLTQDPNIDELYLFNRPSGWIHRQHPFEIIEHLQLGKYDLGVLLTNSFSSAWWFWRGKVANTIGYADHWRSLLLDKAVSYPPNKEKQHLVHTYKEMLAPLGIGPSDKSPRLYLSEAEKGAARDLLKLYGFDPSKHILVGINPGAAYGTAKCWIPERFREVARKLLENPDLYVVFFGDMTGASLVHEICRDMPKRVIDLAGKTNIRELMALVECCNIFLTNDSGPMHMASALGTRLLALFGSTSDTKTGPYTGGTVIHKHTSCSPCYKRVCPIDFRCMTRISVDEVYRQLEELLSDQHVQQGKR